jgi:Domain of unknown function (DUF4129)
MKLLAPLLRPLLLLLIASCAAQSTPSPPNIAAPLTLDAYRMQLRSWSQQVGSLAEHPEQAPKLRASLPKESVVSTGARPMEVSYSWLNQALAEFIAAKPERKPELLRQMQTHLAAQGGEAGLFGQPEAYPASSRQKLSQILARREFRTVHGPTLWDQVVQRVQRWIVHWLDRMFRKVSYVPHGGEIFVWCAIALAAIVVVIWLKRTAERQIIDWPREPILFAPSQKHWRKWLADAREVAHQGHWRDAIHLAYWAAISQLEQAGAWPPDRARTPREYLRLLPEASDKRPALDTLTRRFEIIWYGQHEAGADDFADTIVQLEKLGCR